MEGINRRGIDGCINYASFSDSVKDFPKSFDKDNSTEESIYRKIVSNLQVFASQAVVIL